MAIPFTNIMESGNVDLERAKGFIDHPLGPFLLYWLFPPSLTRQLANVHRLSCHP